MLIALWSPKGGQGTSVVAAATAVVLGRGVPGACRLVDLDGDQPAILGVEAPDLGAFDWMATGPAAPVEALDRLVVDVPGGIELLGAGRARPAAREKVPPEAGANLVVALRDGPVPVVVDCGRATTPAARAVAEVADATFMVLRPCYLALRRAVASPVLGSTRGVLLVSEGGRALGRRDISSVLDRPVVAQIPMRDVVARAVDAGVLAVRLPDVLARAVHVLERELGGRQEDAAA